MPTTEEILRSALNDARTKAEIFESAMNAARQADIVHESALNAARQENKELQQQVATLKAQLGDAGEANLLGQALIKLLASFGYKKG